MTTKTPKNTAGASGADFQASTGTASAPAFAAADASAPAYVPVEIPVDKHHGIGGEYQLVNGVRRLVSRTAEEGADLQPDTPRA